MKILIIGGSKSGKSHLAQELSKALSQRGPMYYWATMEPVDAEDRARIERHIEDRAGWGFSTVERGRGLVSAPLPPDAEEAAVLFDSVTALVTNELFGDLSEETFADTKAAVLRAEEAKRRSVAGLLRLSEGFCHCIAVADDVFRDGREYDEMTELWRAALADTLRALAAEFDTVIEVTAGIMLLRKGRLPVGITI